MPNQFTYRPLAEAIWPRYAVVGECWEWTAKRDRNGYGKLNVSQRTIFAHRAAYELSFGPIPVGMSVCHRCDNPPCIRPSHLFVGTSADNLRDMHSKGRGLRGDTTTFRKYPHLIRRGERALNSKLTETDVRAIRVEVSAGPRGTMERLSREYGVDPDTIRKIARRERWKHVV